MRRPIVLPRLLIARSGLLMALAVATAACRGEGPMACTEIGCSDGLNVELTGTLPPSFTVAVLGEDQVLGRMDCPSSATCGRHLFFENVAAQRVRLVVTVAGVSRSYERTPEWRATRPNGPGCEPVCRQASVSVPID